MIGILWVWGLAKAPAMPVAAQPQVFAPLWPQLRASRAFVRFAAWSLLTSLAVAASTVYQPLI